MFMKCLQIELKGNWQRYICEISLLNKHFVWGNLTVRCSNSEQHRIFKVLLPILRLLILLVLKHTIFKLSFKVKLLQYCFVKVLNKLWKKNTLNLKGPNTLLAGRIPFKFKIPSGAGHFTFAVRCPPLVYLMKL